MARIVLKIDVDTLRGTREGVPNLARIFDRFSARATFLFSLGPDHTGWALRRVFRPGFLKKVSRTSVVEHYGVKQLMYGVLLPGPDIGRRAIADMRAIHEAGFECGIHTWDHVYWQDNVRARDRDWTAREMQKSHARFIEIFGAPPVTHGAAGWQMNDSAFEQIDAWGCATHPTAAAIRRTCPSSTAARCRTCRCRPRCRRSTKCSASTASTRTTSPRTSSSSPKPIRTTRCSRCMRNWKARSSRPCSSNCSPAGARKATRLRRWATTTRRWTATRCHRTLSRGAKFPAAPAN
ncbi:polysaccharide deacetylase family protein [Burkholderia cepacia]|nr:polysaccharide deacetylase family protein [Burkholderia cepacia]